MGGGGAAGGDTGGGGDGSTLQYANLVPDSTKSYEHVSLRTAQKGTAVPSTVRVRSPVQGPLHSHGVHEWWWRPVDP